MQKFIFHQSTFLTSTTFPSIAAAATIAGLISNVLPVGLPWRPLKFLFELLAQISLPCSLSGFMPRHIEQPASLHSNPAFINILSRPSFSACTLRSEEHTSELQ